MADLVVGRLEPLKVERVQTGMRVVKSLMKVMKGLAEYNDLSLGGLMEGIILHTLEGKKAFGYENLKVSAQLKELYGCDLKAGHYHNMTEGK